MKKFLENIPKLSNKSFMKWPMKMDEADLLFPIIEDERMKHCQRLLETLINSNARRATYYESEKHTIRATRIKYFNGFDKHKLEIQFTDGRPNYAERLFIKRAKKAGRKFPINEIQLQYLKGKKA